MINAINLQADAWRLILAALEDKHWDFRTIEGIAAETGLDTRIVKKQLELHKNDIRRSLKKDSKGRELYTSMNRKVGFREFLSDMQVFASKSYLHD